MKIKNLTTCFFIKVDILSSGSFTLEFGLESSILEIMDDSSVVSSILDKDVFLSLSGSGVIIPKNLTDTIIWKKLQASSKEIYRSLASRYNYELGVAKITHAQLLNEAGIGGNATVVKSLNALEDKGIIVRVEDSNSRSDQYLMPYQEKFYAAVCGLAVRNFTEQYKISKKKKSLERDSATNRLFFKICYNLSMLGVESPDKLIGKYSSDSDSLRNIWSMCDSAYIAKKYNLLSSNGVMTSLLNAIKSMKLNEDIFSDDIMLKIRNIRIKNKQNITE